MAFNLSKLSGNEKIDILCFQAGFMHDEGKKRIDYRLLAKSEPLRPVERQLLDQHTLFTFQILNSRGIKKEICEMALHHHENHDGSGYPGKLSGEEIPVGSRIIRICDVYDALTSKREYRKGQYYSQEEALMIMESMKEKFDPDLFYRFKESISLIVQSNSESAVEERTYKDFILRPI